MPLAMHTAFAPLRHQPRSLQRLLHPCVAEFDLMLLPQPLVKTPYLEIVTASRDTTPTLALPERMEPAVPIADADDLGRLIQA